MPWGLAAALSPLAGQVGIFSLRHCRQRAATPDHGWELLPRETSTGLRLRLGILQSAPRAKIVAICSVLQWAALTLVQIVIWRDALRVVRNLQRPLAGDVLDDDDDDGDDDAANGDIKTRIQQGLTTLPPGMAAIRHVPPHLDAWLVTGLLEEWVMLWNNAQIQQRGLLTQTDQ